MQTFDVWLEDRIGHQYRRSNHYGTPADRADVISVYKRMAAKIPLDTQIRTRQF